ncbi:MAG: hypothetical protein K6B68_06620 [Eubacterium sp.]|nr:hypothetical protein [Eubacterium sp.]
MIEEIKSYHRDIDIAKAAIMDSLLYPNEEVLYDLYAVPSHNHQAFYAIIYRKDNHFEMVYAKTEIYSVKYEEPIRMYTFYDADKASAQPNLDGRIIVGIARLDGEFINNLMDAVSNVRETHNNDNGFVLDCVFQAIRRFHNSEIDKEIIYHDDIVSDNPGVKEFLDNMYLYIENMIS